MEFKKDLLKKEEKSTFRIILGILFFVISIVWVAEAIIGEARGVIVGETDSANPPQARIGRVNKIKSLFIMKVYRLRRWLLHLQLHPAG